MPQPSYGLLDGGADDRKIQIQYGEAPAAESATKRTYGTGDYDTRNPTYYVSSTTPDKFDPLIFEQMRLVENGSVVTGVSYKTDVDGINFFRDGAEKKEENQYMDITSWNSWTHDVAEVVANSASFFVSLYSHITFISVTVNFHFFSNDVLEDAEDLMVSRLSLGMVTIILVEYFTVLIFSWRKARQDFAFRADQGEIIQKCDLCSDAPVSWWRLWVTFFEMVVMNMAGISIKVRSVPTYFHNRKVGAAQASLRTGGARLLCTAYPNEYMFKEFAEPAYLSRVCICLMLDMALNGVKAWTAWYIGSGIGFNLVNVVIPVCLNVITLRGVVKRSLVRQGLWKFCQKSLATSDPQLRTIVRHWMALHFGVEVEKKAWEKSPLTASSEYTNAETVARRLDFALQDMQLEMGVLEHHRKFRDGEAGDLLQKVKQRLREAAFPCFFEVASRSQIVTAGGFPHSLGPFALASVEFAPLFNLVDGKPDSWQLAASGSNVKDGQRFRLSNVSQVTLEPDEKMAAGISEDAEWFAWSYGEARQDDDGAQQENFSDHALMTLCRTGGYMYFGKDFQLVQALSVTRLREHGYVRQATVSQNNNGIIGFRKPIGVDSGSPVAIAWKSGKVGPGSFVSGMIEGAFPSLKVVWIPSESVKSETPCHGGFMFYLDE